MVGDKILICESMIVSHHFLFFDALAGLAGLLKYLLKIDLYLTVVYSVGMSERTRSPIIDAKTTAQVVPVETFDDNLSAAFTEGSAFSMASRLAALAD